MKRFTKWGNDLYTGETSIGFVARRKTWFLIAALLILVSLAAPFIRGGFNFGIEFTGGSEFQVSAPATQEQQLATDAASEYSETPARVQLLGDGSVRVQTDSLTQEENAALRADLAEAYGTSVDEVAVSTIGPSWGADITRQMIIGVVVFLVLAAAFMSFYFRTWKMALAAILALFHDLIVTAGVYALTGVEITPAAVIGFLTILGYSLYDTVVVFDKVRENTENYAPGSPRTLAESINLAINQTLVRSINTSVVALLPVMAILFVGAFIMGAGTLLDISLALFIGILVGALSTIFLAGPLYAGLRSREPKVLETDAEIRRRRDAGIAPDVEDDDDEDDDKPARPERENDGAQV
ncbi:protein translocase subunit SecF [Gulosibacter faecalis]|jgi:preprotein translocase subunit SecF|uniref:Protein-export membrane protein SecF n=1 Tax=Gulosibacter faecalis TaxID=272240 RepID=A0ABW5UZI3_9MICO|nr:protein translocase subunit SecF [Gulosibacter faecalis]